MRGQNSSLTQFRATRTSTPLSRRSPFSISHSVSPRCRERTASRPRFGSNHACGITTSARSRVSCGTVQLQGYAGWVVALKTLHIFGAIFMVGGVTAHVLLRPLATRASNDVRIGLYHLAWRIQVLMVYLGSGLLLVTGVLLWFGRFKLLTGWLLLGFLLYVAAAGLDGAFLSPNLRRTRASLKTGTADAPEPAAATIQVITWFLLAVVVFLMTARPF